MRWHHELAPFVRWLRPPANTTCRCYVPVNVSACTSQAIWLLSLEGIRRGVLNYWIMKNVSSAQLRNAHWFSTPPLCMNWDMDWALRCRLWPLGEKMYIGLAWLGSRFQILISMSDERRFNVVTDRWMKSHHIIPWSTAHLKLHTVSKLGKDHLIPRIP